MSYFETAWSWRYWGTRCFCNRRSWSCYKGNGRICWTLSCRHSEKWTNLLRNVAGGLCSDVYLTQSNSSTDKHLTWVCLCPLRWKCDRNSCRFDRLESCSPWTRPQHHPYSSFYMQVLPSSCLARNRRRNSTGRSRIGKWPEVCWWRWRCETVSYFDHNVAFNGGAGVDHVLHMRRDTLRRVADIRARLKSAALHKDTVRK